MQRLLCIWFAVLLWLGSTTGHAVDISDDFERLSVGKHLQYLKDENATLSLADVQTRADGWETSQADVPNFGFTYTPYWFRLTLTTHEVLPVYFLEVAYALLDEVDLYVVSDRHVIEHWRVGNSLPVSARPLRHRLMVFPLHLQPQTDYTLYMRVRSSNSLQLPITLWEERSFWQEDQIQVALCSAYFGIVVVMCLYNLFLYFSLREISYFYYVLVIFIVAMFQASLHGYSYLYLWPDYPAWNTRSIGCTITLSNALFLMLCSTFLGIPEHFPRLNRLQNLFIVLSFIGLASVLVFPPQYVIPLLTVNVALSSTLQMVFSFLLWNKDRSAKLFFVAWYALIAGTELMALSKIGLIEYSFLNENLLQIGAVLEAFLLSLALAERIRMLETDKSSAMQALLVATEESHRHEQREQRAIAESKAKSDFLAKMSHEIRTPMNGILGMSQLLDKRLLDPVDRHYNNIIHSSGTSLLTLINDILDLSKIESGKLELEDTVFSLRALLKETLSIFQIKSEESQIALRWHVDGSVDDYHLGDPHRLRQVLINLIGNAFKFTQHGEICVQVSVAGSDGQQLKFAVSDTGIGISPAVQERLFQAFQQADASTTRRYGGTGLGLSICRQLAELMHGETGVQSSPGKGSTFWFTARLPLHAPPTGEPAIPMASEASDHARHLNVLVADDNQVNRLVINGMLNKLGHSVTLASNGHEAVHAFRSTLFEGAPRFDCILMDCEMPEMDGFEATGEIRQLQMSHQGTHIPIIALTAHALQSNLDRCLESGMDHTLTKPVDMKKLSEALYTYQPSDAAEEPTQRRNRSGTGQ